MWGGAIRSACPSVRTGELFGNIDLEARLRRDDPLPAIRTIVNEALSEMQRELGVFFNSPLGGSS
jgi:hypothetical protein